MKAFIVCVIFACVFVEAFGGQIPEAVAQYGIKKVDGFFACSKYDGAAGCWHNNSKKRDIVCRDPAKWEHNRFEYVPWFKGTCYCCIS